MPNVTYIYQDSRYWRMTVFELAIANALVRQDEAGDDHLPVTLSDWFQREVEADDIEPVLDGLLERELLQPDHDYPSGYSLTDEGLTIVSTLYGGCIRMIDRGLGLFHSALLTDALTPKENPDD